MVRVDNMSVDINGACYVDLSLDGLDGLNIKNFMNLLLVESSGLKIPMLEISLLQTDYRLAKVLNESNKLLTLKIGTNPTNAKTHEFLILNHSYSSYGQFLKLTFYCLSNLTSFMSKGRIRSFPNKTSNQVLSSIDSIKVITEYTGNDSMTWIQHNNSDWDFTDKIIDYSFSDKDDCIVGSITIERELYVRSIRKLFSQEPSFTFTNTAYHGTPDQCSILRIYPESDTAVYSKLLSEGRTLPVQDAIKRRLVVFRTSTDSISGTGNTNLVRDNVNIPTRYNNGNCHSNYFQAWLDNYSNSVKMNRDVIYIVTNSNYVNNDVLRVGDLTKIIYNDKVHASDADPISGKYMLAEKCTRMSPVGFLHRFKLLRDYQG